MRPKRLKLDRRVPGLNRLGLGALSFLGSSPLLSGVKAEALIPWQIPAWRSTSVRSSLPTRRLTKPSPNLCRPRREDTSGQADLGHSFLGTRFKRHAPRGQIRGNPSVPYRPSPRLPRSTRNCCGDTPHRTRTLTEDGPPTGFCGVEGRDDRLSPGGVQIGHAPTWPPPAWSGLSGTGQP